MCETFFSDVSHVSIPLSIVPFWGECVAAMNKYRRPQEQLESKPST